MRERNLWGCSEVQQARWSPQGRQAGAKSRTSPSRGLQLGGGETREGPLSLLTCGSKGVARRPQGQAQARVWSCWSPEPLWAASAGLVGHGPPLPSVAPPKTRSPLEAPEFPSARPPGSPTTSVTGEAQSLARCRGAAFLGPCHCPGVRAARANRSPALLTLPVNLGLCPGAGTLSRVSLCTQLMSPAVPLEGQWALPCPAPSSGLRWSGECGGQEATSQDTTWT